jgi:hypothetical protein
MRVRVGKGVAGIGGRVVLVVVVVVVVLVLGLVLRVRGLVVELMLMLMLMLLKLGLLLLVGTSQMAMGTAVTRSVLIHISARSGRAGHGGAREGGRGTGEGSGGKRSEWSVEAERSEARGGMG